MFYSMFYSIFYSMFYSIFYSMFDSISYPVLYYSFRSVFDSIFDSMLFYVRFYVRFCVRLAGQDFVGRRLLPVGAAGEAGPSLARIVPVQGEAGTSSAVARTEGWRPHLSLWRGRRRPGRQRSGRRWPGHHPGRGPCVVRASRRPGLELDRDVRPAGSLSVGASSAGIH